VERAAQPAAGGLRIQARGRVERARPIDEDPGLDRGVQRVDPAETRLHERAARQPARADARRGLGAGEVVEGGVDRGRVAHRVASLYPAAASEVKRGDVSSVSKEGPMAYEGPRSYRPVIMGRRGASASTPPPATQAGLLAPQAGGNAVDAAVAVASTLSVVEPMMSGLGGDGFYHVFMRRTGEAVVVNGTGPAPRAATPERYR